MKIDDTNTARSGIQVIARAAAIMRAMKENPGGLSLAQIASIVSLPRSTVQRIISALQAERFVTAATGGGGFKLGPELSALAEATRYNIVEQCRILLFELAQNTGETSDLSVLRGDTMIFLDQVPGTHRLRTISSVGEVFPLTSTANGRACLAKLPQEKALELAGREWKRRNVPPDIQGLTKILDQIRDSGIALDVDEHTDGICAIGFAFSDWAGDLHAISVPVPSTRFERQKSKITDEILRTKALVDKMMHRGDA